MIATTETRGTKDGATLAAMETAVVAACDQQVDWRVRIAAGVQAALVFAANEPADPDRYRKAIGRFSEMLGDSAPPGQRVPASTDEGLVVSIATVVGQHVRIGSGRALEQVAPDLAFLVLLPYVGFPDAKYISETLETPGM